MNNKVRKQDLEKILFFDIETIRRNKELDVNSKEYSLYAWKLRDKETSELPSQEIVIKHYELSGALDPTFNKVVCITVGFIKDNTLYLKSLTGEQKTIIEDFYGILNSTGFTPCGHNIIQFDMPTLRLKAFESGIDLSMLSDKHSDSQQKPWILSDNFMDTMDITKGTYYYNLSLDAMCFLAGIETPKEGISGADVSRVYYGVENGLQIISDYCKKDVKAVAKLFCALQGRKGFIKDVVDKTETTTVEPFTEEQPLLQKIYKASNIDSKTKEDLHKKLAKKKITKKEKLIIEDILVSLYIDNTMFSSDKPEVKERKKQEIKQFLDEIK